MINETELLQRKSGEPIQKINELLEKQNMLQKQNHDYKENIQKLIKENQEQYKNILVLEKQRDELLQENENINNSLIEMDSKLKPKIPNTTDFKKRFKNMGQSSLNMVRHSIDNSNTKNNGRGSNAKNTNDMNRKSSNYIYSNTNTNEGKIKNASNTMTDFRKKKSQKNMQ